MSSRHFEYKCRSLLQGSDMCSEHYSQQEEDSSHSLMQWKKTCENFDLNLSQWRRDWILQMCKPILDMISTEDITRHSKPRRCNATNQPNPPHVDPVLESKNSTRHWIQQYLAINHHSHLSSSALCYLNLVSTGIINPPSKLTYLLC